MGTIVRVNDEFRPAAGIGAYVNWYPALKDGSDPPSTLSRMFFPLAQMAPVFSSTRVAEYPMFGQVAAYVVSPVSIVRADSAADASFADIFDLIRLGMAIAAMIRIIATTISNSISENPCCWRF